MKKLAYPFLLLLLTLHSCGGSDKITDEQMEAYTPKLTSTELNAKSTTIKGELSDYLTIISETVKVSFLGVETGLGGAMNDNQQQWEVKLNVKRTAKELEWDIEELNGNYTNLSITVLDESGAPISGLDDTESVSGHTLIDEILSLNSGEDGWVTFVIRKGDYKEEDIIKNWSKLEVNSSVGFVKESTSSSSNESYDDLDLSAEGSEEFDEMLDDYEKYFDEYLKFYKKAIEGDQSAMSQYPELLEKANKLQKSIQRAQEKNELSVAQIKRMADISAKMLEAASQMQ